VGVVHGRCEDCEDEVVDLAEPEALFEVIAKSIVQAERPIHPKEIRFLRSLVGWSQENLAVSLGLTRLTIARWETGEGPKQPMMHLLLRIVWLHQFLQHRREHACGVLTNEDLVQLSGMIATLGEAIQKIRSAAQGPARVSINVKTRQVETEPAGCC
jgi:DNA-binding transcriptional regulator YiaG